MSKSKFRNFKEEKKLRVGGSDYRTGAAGPKTSFEILVGYENSD